MKYSMNNTAACLGIFLFRKQTGRMRQLRSILAIASVEGGLVVWHSKNGEVGKDWGEGGGVKQDEGNKTKRKFVLKGGLYSGEIVWIEDSSKEIRRTMDRYSW